MPQIANVTLTDDQTADIFFLPQGVNSGQATYVATAYSDVPAGQPRLKVGVQLPPKGSTVRKILMKLEIPILETNTSTTPESVRVVRTMTFDGVFFLPVTCAESERDKLLACVRDLIDENLITQLVSDLEMIY